MTEVIPPYILMPFGSTAGFTTTNQPIMKVRIKSALKKAFNSTFLYGGGEDGEELAEKFAEAAAEPISSAVAEFVNGCIKAQQINITIPPSVVSPMGPCTGMIPMAMVQIS